MEHAFTPVDTKLSLAAKKRNLPAVFRKICGSCKVKAGSEPDGADASSWRPPFCSARDAPKAEYSFSALKPRYDATLAAPEKLVVVFCAIGSRYYGPGGQEYVWEAVRQWRVFHDAATSDVRVVVNRAQSKDARIVANASRFDVRLEINEELTSPERKRFAAGFYIQGYMHPGGSRKTGNQHFNRLVSERFFAVHALMLRDGLRHVVHMENDMMVYEPFQPIVAAWMRCGSALASITPSLKGVIPGVLFVRDAPALAKLVTFISDILACGEEFGQALQPGYANDMTYLLNYYQYYGTAALGDLPNQLHAAGENCIADELGRSVVLDGASFGQWYSFALSLRAPKPGIVPDGDKGGTTTRAVDEVAMRAWVRDSADASQPLAENVPKAHIRMAMKGRFLDATPPPLATWTADAAGRRVPRWKGLRVAVLHVHAKNLWWFRSA